MAQGILIFSCLLLVGLVVAVPVGHENNVIVDDKPFQVEDCGKPIEDSTEFACRALFPRYKWSVSDKDCVGDFYGGCHATKNNFKTKAECLQVAKPICQSVTN